MEPSHTYVYKELGSGVLGDTFVTLDRATLKFESSNLIAEKANITLAWRKQEVES